jgi:hypothetical protein
MLAAAGPLDLRTGARIDSGRALAMTNDMQYHHFFPKAWLMRHEVSYEEANLLANIVMLTAISNQGVADYPPAAYLKDEIDFCGEVEMRPVPARPPAPSPQDTETTARLRRGAATVGLRFLDHVILTETAWAPVS